MPAAEITLQALGAWLLLGILAGWAFAEWRKQRRDNDNGR